MTNSPLVAIVTFKKDNSVKLTTSKDYDRLNRLTAISSAAGTPLSYGYWHNDANQRVRTTLADGSRWVYEYDALGQIKSGKKFWADGTPVAGQQFEYSFDDIGNRTATKSGGDALGGDLRSASYSPDLLNQYTQRTNPPAIDVLGAAHAQATVLVNSQAAYRKGEFCAY